MARWRRYVEIYAFCSIIPISGGIACYALWHMFIWSFGGRAEMRRLTINEPLQEKWFESDPAKTVFFRDAPLSNVPKHIMEKPAGSKEAAERQECQASTRDKNGKSIDLELTSTSSDNDDSFSVDGGGARTTTAAPTQNQTAVQPPATSSSLQSKLNLPPPPKSIMGGGNNNSSSAAPAQNNNNTSNNNNSRPQSVSGTPTTTGPAKKSLLSIGLPTAPIAAVASTTTPTTQTPTITTTVNNNNNNIDIQQQQQRSGSESRSSSAFQQQQPNNTATQNPYAMQHQNHHHTTPTGKAVTAATVATEAAIAQQRQKYPNQNQSIAAPASSVSAASQQQQQNRTMTSSSAAAGSTSIPPSPSNISRISTNKKQTSQSATPAASTKRQQKGSTGGAGGGASSARSASQLQQQEENTSGLSDVPDGVNFLMKMGSLYSTYKQRLAAEKQKETAKTMQAKPTISEFAKHMRHSEDVLTRLASSSVNRMRLHEQKREKERLKKEEEKMQKELAECTFKPEIDEISKHKPRHGTVHEINQKWMQEREKKLEFARKKKEEKELMEQQPGPQIVYNGRYADPSEAEARRHGLNIADHLLELGKQRDRRMYERVQEQIEGRSASQHQFLHASIADIHNNNHHSSHRRVGGGGGGASRSATPYDGYQRSASAPSSLNQSAISRGGASVDVANVVNRLYTPNKRAAVFDEEYVNHCTFQPKVYSTFEDPLGHLPVHERLRMRNASDHSIRRHHQLLMEMDNDKTGIPRISERSVELVAEKRAKLEMEMIQSGLYNADAIDARSANHHSGVGITQFSSPSQRLYQDAFQRDERLMKLQQQIIEEERGRGKKVNNTPLKNAARRAGARPPSPAGGSARGRSTSVSSQHQQQNGSTIFERSKHWEERKAQNQQKLKQELEKEEAERNKKNCSFNPITNTRSSVRIQSAKDSFEERALMWKKMRDQRLEDQRKQREKEMEEKEQEQLRENREALSFKFKARPAPSADRAPSQLPSGYTTFVERQQKGLMMKHEKEAAAAFRPDGEGSFITGKNNYNKHYRQRSTSLTRNNQDHLLHHDHSSSSLLVSPAATPSKQLVMMMGDPNNNNRNSNNNNKVHYQQRRIENQKQNVYVDPRMSLLDEEEQEQQQNEQQNAKKYSYMADLRRQMAPVDDDNESSPEISRKLAAPASSSLSPEEERQRTKTTIGGIHQRPLAPQLSPEARSRNNLVDPHDMLDDDFYRRQQNQQQNNNRSSETDRRLQLARSSKQQNQERVDRVYVRGDGVVAGINSNNNRTQTQPQFQQQQQQQREQPHQTAPDDDARRSEEIQRRARELLNRSAALRSGGGPVAAASQQQQQIGNNNRNLVALSLPPPPLAPQAPI